jgi:transcriptional regulator with XRE-family HTH domain
MSSIHDPRYSKLITLLISIREDKAITQVELATSLKKHQSYVAKVENFDRRLDIIELNDWLKELNVTLSEFVQVLDIDSF